MHSRTFFIAHEFKNHMYNFYIWLKKINSHFLLHQISKWRTYYVSENLSHSQGEGGVSIFLILQIQKRLYLVLVHRVIVFVYLFILRSKYSIHALFTKINFYFTTKKFIRMNVLQSKLYVSYLQCWYRNKKN